MSTTGDEINQRICEALGLDIIGTQEITIELSVGCTPTVTVLAYAWEADRLVETLETYTLSNPGAAATRIEDLEGDLKSSHRREGLLLSRLKEVEAELEAALDRLGDNA